MPAVAKHALKQMGSRKTEEPVVLSAQVLCEQAQSRTAQRLWSQGCSPPQRVLALAESLSMWR